jgi:RNA polymerase sigma factor (sigma-70 family)
MDQLIEKAMKGSHNAIIALVEQEEDVLYPIAYTYMKNEEDALDVMQELTYKALKKMHTVKQPEYVRTWLVRVLINCCKDHLKKRLYSEQLQENSAHITPSYSDIERLLNQLTLNEQQLVYAKYFQQLKNNEIARIHQIPEGTVKSKLHHILKKLRKVAGQKEDWL